MRKNGEILKLSKRHSLTSTRDFRQFTHPSRVSGRGCWTGKVKSYSCSAMSTAEIHSLIWAPPTALEQISLWFLLPNLVKPTPQETNLCAVCRLLGSFAAFNRIQFDKMLVESHHCLDCFDSRSRDEFPHEVLDHGNH